jgi:transposase
VCQHLTVARVAEGLGVSWNTANDAVLPEGKRALIDDGGRFDSVKALGVDEHMWRTHPPRRQIRHRVIDLTGIRDGTGPARLLDMVEGRSKQRSRPGSPSGHKPGDAVEVVAMDGFTGFKTATTEKLPTPSQSWTPFTWSAWPETPSIAVAGACSRSVMETSALLAYFDRPGTPNGPTEAINGRLELRSSALGFRNLTNYIARSLLETGGFRPRLHPKM